MLLISTLIIDEYWGLLLISFNGARQPLGTTPGKMAMGGGKPGQTGQLDFVYFRRRCKSLDT
jgi:hypothetical protein